MVLKLVPELDEERAAMQAEATTIAERAILQRRREELADRVRADFLAGHAGELEALILRVLEPDVPNLRALKRTDVGKALAAIDGREGPTWPMMSTADIFAPLPPRSYPISGFAMSVGPPTMFGAFSFGGKTVILQDLALALATDEKVWWHYQCEPGGKILHVDYEQGPDETRDRYHRLARGRGLSFEAIAQRGRLELCSFPPTYMTDPRAESIYKHHLEGKTLAILDTFAAATPGVDENESSIGDYLHMLSRCSYATGCLIAVAHHMGKSSFGGSGRDGRPDAPKEPRALFRGHSAIIGACGYAYAIGGARGEPKLVQQAKARGLGDPQTEDFYLDLQTHDVREPRPELDWPGYFNPHNPADPGAFRVVYKTQEQIHPPAAKAKEETLEGDCAQVLEYIRGEIAHGRPVATRDAPAKTLKMRKGDCLNAVKALLARGVLEERGKRGAQVILVANKLPLEAPSAPESEEP